MLPPSSSRAQKFGRGRRMAGSSGVLAACLLALAGSPRAALGQVSPGLVAGTRKVPPYSYHAVFPAMWDGEYLTALKAFRDEGRGAIKTVDSRWIDSICYHAMTGECHYQLGQLEAALDHFASALKLYLAFPDWMVRVQFQPLPPAGPMRPAPWGQSTRGALQANFPEHIEIAQGKLDNSQAFTQGGVVQRPLYYPINVIEIVRCTTLAMRRYRELLGPLAPGDPLSRQLVTALARRPGPVNHWSECWIDLQFGLANLLAGKPEQAKTALTRSVLSQGQFDHPLTGIALLELGKLAIVEGDSAQAAKLFEEASYSAYFANDPLLIEEAFRQGFHLHLLTNQAGQFPPLAAATPWARANKFRQLAVALGTLAAENQAWLGQPREAEQLLSQARGLMASRDLMQSRAGAHLNYVAALLAYQRGESAAAGDALAAALLFGTQGLPFSLQWGLLHERYAAGSVSPRQATELYGQMLADPSQADWSQDPLAALSRLTAFSQQAYENWFEATLARKDYGAALTIADHMRRQRFWSTQELGGRLLALRQILAGPAQGLPQPVELERQNWLSRAPDFVEAAQRAAAAAAALDQVDWANLDAAERPRRTGEVAHWAQECQRQERLLWAIVLRRDACTRVVPPLYSLAELQTRLAPDQALISFFFTSNQAFGFFVRRDRLTVWPIDRPPNALNSMVGKLLRELGQVDANRPVAWKLLDGDTWRKPAAELWNVLWQGSRAELTEVAEVAIVPDGPLWYVPFELMPLSASEPHDSLGRRCRIRLAPTNAWAVSDYAHRRRGATTAVALGSLAPRDEPEVAREAFGEMAQRIPATLALAGAHPTPSACFAGLFGRLAVFDDLAVDPQDPLGFRPLASNKEAAGARLDDWPLLPLAAPETLLLPGYHTFAEQALKKMPPGKAGQDLFLPLCALRASGVRTVLISRWRPAGATCYHLMREFLAELDSVPASEAWQRSVFLAQDQSLDLEREPRVEHDPQRETATAAHPFFWAGYLLADPGEPPPEDLPPVTPMAPPPTAADDPPAPDDAPADAPAVPARRAPPAAPAGEVPPDAPPRPAANAGEPATN